MHFAFMELWRRSQNRCDFYVPVYHTCRNCGIIRLEYFFQIEKRCLPMQIGCTKKLRDLLKRDGRPYDTEV